MEGTNEPEGRDEGVAPPGEAVPPPPALEPPSLDRQRPPHIGRDYLGDVTALLQNRFILFGLGTVVVLLLLTVVLVVVGDGDDGKTPSAIRPTTPGRDATDVPPLVGLPGRLLSTVTMRNGPDSTYAILGTISKGARLAVVGRNEDATWLQVIYPPGRQLRGWVNATALQVDGDVATLVIAGPGSGPQVPIPTSFGFITPVLPTEPATTPLGGGATATGERPTRTPRPIVTEGAPTRTPRSTPAQ